MKMLWFLGYSKQHSLQVCWRIYKILFFKNNVSGDVLRSVNTLTEYTHCETRFSVFDDKVYILTF